MKKILFLFIAMVVLVYGCSHEEDTPVQPASKLIFKASDGSLTQSTTETQPSDPVLFTGDDILWFNGSTKEIRFKDNMYQTQASFSISHEVLKFYLGETYLFLSFLFVSDINSQIINSLVFYYNTTENRYYLKDGYPELSIALDKSSELQKTRDENMKSIEKEWQLFIAQLKEEGKYKEY